MTDYVRKWSPHVDSVTEQVKTWSGYTSVSTPERAAFDLVRYRKGAGSIDHVATVLAERLDAKWHLLIDTSIEVEA